MPDYTSAAGRTLWEKVGEQPSALDWRAVGDGATVCNPFLDDAIANCRRNLLLPYGRFRLTSLLEINVPSGESFCLRGMGEQSVLVLDDVTAGLKIAGTPG